MKYTEFNVTKIFQVQSLSDIWDRWGVNIYENKVSLMIPGSRLLQRPSPSFSAAAIVRMKLESSNENLSFRLAPDTREQNQSKHTIFYVLS